MRSLRLVPGLLLLVAPAAAQTGFVAPASVISGVQAIGYDFGSGYPTNSISQVAVPIAVLIPIGKRLSLDAGTFYASTRVTPAVGSHETLNGFTDTQLRGSYVVGKDALVVSLMANLPTGKKTVSTSVLSGYAANNFLLFPVNAYTNGASITGGLALAGTTGGWNLGIAGSVRYNGQYEPYTDQGSALTYKPALEGRARVGADRLLGSSRFQVGFTFSTFGTDNFGGSTGGGLSTNQPGNRYIGEMSLAAPVSSGSISVYVWDFYRAARGTPTPNAIEHENIFTSGVSSSWSLNRSLALEPGVEARFWMPNDGTGQLYSAAAGLRWSLSPHLAFTPGGKFGFGHIRAPGAASASSLTGWGANGLLRYTF